MLNIAQPYPQQFQTDVRQGKLDYLRQQMVARQQEYILYREYDDGIHRTQLTERQRQYLQTKQDIEFTANYCPMVIDAKTNRLKVNGFDCDDDTQKERIWKWWRKNRMDARQNVVQRAAIRDGDAFVLVEWDNEAKIPRFNYEPGYAAADGVMVYYSDERRDEIEFASKHWCISRGIHAGKVRRMNLYFPNRIEKYISDDDSDYGKYLPYEVDADEIGAGYLGLAGISWWTDTRTKTGKPLGMPIVHFKHNDKGDSYGTSHLANVVPMQDVADKLLIDLLGAADTDAFDILAGYGTNEWANIKVGPGAVAAVSKSPQEAKLERVSGGDGTTKLIAAYGMSVMEIARISGTPLSYFQVSGQVSAEGTLKQQETALVSQVEKTQTDFGNSWESMMNIARRLENAFGEGGMDEDELIETVWEEAASRNDKEQAETLAIRVEKLGVSESQAQTEMGYDETQIAAFKREKMRNQAMAIRISAGTPNTPPNGQPPGGQQMAAQQNMTQTENTKNDTDGKTAA